MCIRDSSRNVYEFVLGVIVLEAANSLGGVAALPLLSGIAGGRRDEYIAVDRALGIVPGAAAPALGGLIATILGFRFMLLILALFMLVPLYAMIMVKE